MQPHHDKLADAVRRHLLAFKRSNHRANEILHFRLGDWALLARNANRLLQFLALEDLSTTIALDHEKIVSVNLLVRGEAIAALQTFAPTANDHTLLRRPRVQHLVVVITALGTLHERNLSTRTELTCHSDTSCSDGNQG